jgi:4-hydroxybenzoate polyprenyltransferase
VINLIMMAAGWGYNAGLKSTSASGVMYLVGFGLIPALVASTLPGHHPARPWALGAAGLIGLGGHFANVLPDLDGDRAAGVRGLPQRVAAAGGSGLVRLVALVLLLSASVLIVFGRRSGPAWYDLVGLAAAVILAIGGGWAPGRLPFLAAIGVAAIDVGLFASGGLVS